MHELENKFEVGTILSHSVWCVCCAEGAEEKMRGYLARGGRREVCGSRLPSSFASAHAPTFLGSDLTYSPFFPAGNSLRSIGCDHNAAAISPPAPDRILLTRTGSEPRAVPSVWAPPRTAALVTRPR
jgi:hypothetical protein